MATKVNVNIDKLKLSYLQPDGLFDTIAAHQVGDKIEYFDFYLKIIDDGRGADPDKIQTRVILLVFTEQGELLGQLTLHQSGDFGNRAFFEAENKLLYTGVSNADGEKCNNISYWQFAGEKLNLTPSTITAIDLAVDINKNIIARTRKHIKNHQDYEMFVNGKKLEDERKTIKGCNLLYNTSRVQMSRIPTLYFRQAEDDGLRQRIYNKSQEIKETENEKKYIEDWDDFGENETIYRNEVTITWKMFKKWIEWINQPDNLPAFTEWKRRESEPQSHYIAYSDDTRSPIPVISVHSVGNLQYRWRS